MTFIQYQEDKNKTKRVCSYTGTLDNWGCKYSASFLWLTGTELRRR